MTEYEIRKFIRVHGTSFPLKKKFNFTGFCKDVKSLIDDDYDYLLTRNRDFSIRKKKEQLKEKLSIDLKNMKLTKKSFFENKKKHLMKKQKLILSSYSNKMILDLMFRDKRYVKYITEKSIENSKNKNNNAFDEKIDNTINNNLIEGNKNKNEIFPSLITYDTINEFNSQSSKISKQENYLNKTYTRFEPNKIKQILNQKNSVFKTEIPFRQSNVSPMLRNSLFNINLKNSPNKYINNNSKFPSLFNNYTAINSRNIKINNQFGKDQKNSELRKTNINYNKYLRKKIIFNDIYTNQKSSDKNKENNNNNSKLNSFSNKNNLFLSNYKPIRIIKSNIIRDVFNSKKQFIKQK